MNTSVLRRIISLFPIPDGRNALIEHKEYSLHSLTVTILNDDECYIQRWVWDKKRRSPVLLQPLKWYMGCYMLAWRNYAKKHGLSIFHTLVWENRMKLHMLLGLIGLLIILIDWKLVEHVYGSKFQWMAALIYLLLDFLILYAIEPKIEK